MLDVANEIRKELKKNGYSSREISVRKRHAGYSSAINVTIKDLTINLKDIKKIVHKFENVGWDERTGEILSGGNTFVFVDYDYMKLCDFRESNNIEQEAKNILEKANAKAKEINNRGICFKLFKDNDNILYDGEYLTFVNGFTYNGHTHLTPDHLVNILTDIKLGKIKGGDSLV